MIAAQRALVQPFWDYNTISIAVILSLSHTHLHTCTHTHSCTYHLPQVNGNDMRNATHAEAVAALKSVSDVCKMVVSREVLVVMPEDMPAEEGTQAVMPFSCSS